MNPRSTFRPRFAMLAAASALALLGACASTPPPMEQLAVGKAAVEKAKSTDVDKVIAAMAGQSFKSPSGFVLTMDPKNHHLHKPVMIGEVKANGQFDVVWATKGPVKADAWSPFIAENKGKVANWTYPWVCGNCTEPKYASAH